MRADRLITILLLLQNKGKMTSSELADKLEVSERTIFRDMEALSIAGIPVFSERGSRGGWSLSEGYRTTLTGMKAEEILSLFISNPSKVLDDLGIQKNFQDAFQKLLASAPKTVIQDVQWVQQRIHIDGAGWHHSSETFPLLAIVQEAIWKEQKLRIHYQREDALVERIVSPLGLVAKRSVWYMVSEIEGSFRTYRISKLVQATLLGESLERPMDFDLAKYWEQSTKQFKQNLPRYPAKLKVDENIISRLEQERYVKIKDTHASSKGMLIAIVDFETRESACEIILGFGSFIEVLVPSELRSEIAATAQAITLIYSNV